MDEQDSLIDRSAGIVRHLSYHEERHNLEQLQLRPVCGDLAIVDVSEGENLAEPLWATARYTGRTATSPLGSTLRGGDAVWSKLLEAISSSRDQCAKPPCGKVSANSHSWAFGPSRCFTLNREGVLFREAFGINQLIGS